MTPDNDRAKLAALDRLLATRGLAIDHLNRLRKTANTLNNVGRTPKLVLAELIEEVVKTTGELTDERRKP